jgi:hypothetical protein
VLPPLHGARSYVALGGVADFLSPLTFGGVSGEAQGTFRFVNVGAFDGGVTINLLDDLSFGSSHFGYPVYESIAGGAGFDLGFLNVLQVGIRFDIGYGSDIANVLLLYGGFVSLGAHAIGWVSRYVGLYFETDGLFPMSRFAPSGVRLAAGLAFALD